MKCATILQPIDTNRYQFIYRLLLKIDTNR